MKKLPSDQLIALHNSVKILVEVYGDFENTYSSDDKRIKTTNDVFTVLHEAGHAIDDRNLKSYEQISSINNDKDLQKIFNKEKVTFDKAYPDAQRNHVGYFIYGKEGNLAEVVIEKMCFKMCLINV